MWESRARIWMAIYEKKTLHFNSPIRWRYAPSSLMKSLSLDRSKTSGPIEYGSGPALLNVLTRFRARTLEFYEDESHQNWLKYRSLTRCNPCRENVRCNSPRPIAHDSVGTPEDTWFLTHDFAHASQRTRIRFSGEGVEEDSRLPLEADSTGHLTVHCELWKWYDIRRDSKTNQMTQKARKSARTRRKTSNDGKKQRKHVTHLRKRKESSQCCCPTTQLCKVRKGSIRGIYWHAYTDILVTQTALSDHSPQQWVWVMKGHSSVRVVAFLLHHSSHSRVTSHLHLICQTVSEKVLNRKESRGTLQRCAFEVQDLDTEWIQSFPMQKYSRNVGYLTEVSRYARKCFHATTVSLCESQAVVMIENPQSSFSYFPSLHHL